MSVLNRLFAPFCLAFLAACAAVNTPDGGPRDEIKPRLQLTEPQNGSTNFSGKTIRLVFDEDVRPKDLNKQLIITPNTGNTYTARNSRQEIILDFNEELAPNTTYLLNFREGIEDITEGNKSLPFTLAFSTGPQLDTGRVSGKVEDYLTGKPEGDITVALYPAEDTSNIRTHKPYYFTRSAPDGSFTLSSIRNGDYRIFAHRDKNNNEFYDQENEKIAYLTDPINIQPAIDSLLLQTVRIDSRKPFVLKTENFLDKNTLNFNEGIKSLELKTLDKQPKTLDLITIRSQDGKKTDVYPSKGTLPARALAFSVDSAGNRGTDTLKLALSGKTSFPDKLTYRTKNGEFQVTPFDKVGLEFIVPIQITGNQPFTIIQDSINQVKPEIRKGFTLNETNTVVTFNTPVTAKKKIEIMVDTTQLTAVNGKPFSKQTIVYNVSDKSSYG
ncbi:MAG TPA: Ig-like domain-containing domain, partial [Adhaeribacter sp.]|nr:Ig-like domain-containing domain [Adhaeribacter sp.]